MFIALKNGVRVIADESLSKDDRYYCPVCNGEVRLRIGDTYAPHFAHIALNSCPDDFAHDMSDWHKEWQCLFPEKNREVVIRNGEEVHRADVLCYGTVIEFQHSHISESEFWRRNDFYTSAGYKVVWILDVIDLICDLDDDGRMSCIDEWRNQWDSGGKYKWKYPWLFLKGFLPQEEENIDVFFQIAPFCNDPKSPEADAYMERVAWVNPNYKTLWGWFHTSYRVCNYAELLQWLKERYLKSKVSQSG